LFTFLRFLRFPRSEWEKAIETIPSDIKENLMTTYTWMKEEGKAEGKLEGKLEGRLEGKLQKEIEVILKGYDESLKISVLANITNLTEDAVIKILKEHNGFVS
jgi:predicted transposase YdaD